MNTNHLHDLKGMLYKITDKNSSWAGNTKFYLNLSGEIPKLQILVKNVKQKVYIETCNPQAPLVGHHWQEDIRVTI